MPVDLVEQQIDAVLSDIAPRAIKTGALGSADLIRLVARKVQSSDAPVVVDPVLVSKHGDRLADEASIAAYREHLMPQATVFTPNRYEAEALLDRKLISLQDCARAAAELRSLGPDFVLLKAGEIDGHRNHMVASDDESVMGLAMEPVESKHTHGAGCVLSAAIAGRLALSLEGELTGEFFDSVVRFATAVVHHSIEYAPELGNGIGPVETRIIRP